MPDPSPLPARRSLQWRRLWQPRHPLFWLMLAFNALSSVCSTALLGWPLTPAWRLLLALVALGNVAMGLLVAWRLLRGG